MARELCKADADVNAEDEEQNSMLRLAAVGGHEEVALVLCQAGSSFTLPPHRDTWPFCASSSPRAQMWRRLTNGGRRRC